MNPLWIYIVKSIPHYRDIFFWSRQYILQVGISIKDIFIKSWIIKSSKEYKKYMSSLFIDWLTIKEWFDDEKEYWDNKIYWIIDNPCNIVIYKWKRSNDASYVCIQ